MRSASQHDFSITPNVNISRSSFRRPQTYKSTMDAGLLYPVFCEEVVPGDTLNMRSATVFSRLMTLITPVMDNIYLDLHAWFVPFRLVMDKWEEVCGARPDPVDDYKSDPARSVPRYWTFEDAEEISDTGFSPGGLADYFGLPPIQGFMDVSLLPFRCYNLIWNTWYRDENLQDRAYTSRSSTSHQEGRADFEEKYHLLPRGKRKDAFTGALPWPQKGPSVQIVGGSAPVIPTDNGYPHFKALTHADLQLHGLSMTAVNGTLNVDPVDPSGKVGMKWLDGSDILSGEPNTGLQVSLMNGFGVTVNMLRESFQLQKMFERDALGGTRYNETILAHFGVHTADARLQRPEFLGGCTIPVKVHTVVQNGATSDVTPQGNLAGFGTAGGQLSFIKSFTEFGYVIILASYRADLTYQQGIDKKWKHWTREQFYWPVFAHLGEDFVMNSELFASGDSSKDGGVFGYQERWYEYRYSRNQITGKLRSDLSGGASLDSWHLAQTFGDTPKLNEEFIVENPPLERVLAVPSEPAFLFDALFDAVWVRPMPMYSVPGLIDHF